MVGHGEIANTHPNPVPLADDKWVDAGEDPRIEGPQVEIEHLRYFRYIAARIDAIGAEEKDEVSSNAHELDIARVDYKESHHAHRHLQHLVGMRVVHEAPALLHLEFVDKGFARFDMRLSEPAHAVHTVGQQHAMPVDGGMFGELV